MPDAHCIVLCTVPDTDTGNRLAALLVEAGHAACVNLVPGLTSTYRWQGKLQQDRESLLIIKTRRDRFDAVQKALLAQHPYELPEIIAVPISAGLPAYLTWIDQTLETTS